MSDTCQTLGVCSSGLRGYAVEPVGRVSASFSPHVNTRPSQVEEIDEFPPSEQSQRWEQERGRGQQSEEALADWLASPSTNAFGTGQLRKAESEGAKQEQMRAVTRKATTALVGSTQGSEWFSHQTSLVVRPSRKYELRLYSPSPHCSYQSDEEEPQAVTRRKHLLLMMMLMKKQ